MLAGALVMPGAACYTFAPVAADVPPVVGERYALHISDQGRVGLAARFGPGVSRVEGRVTLVSPQEFALSIFRVDYFGNPGSTWAGEQARIERAYVSRLDHRLLSRKRTWIAVGVTLAAVGYVAVSRGLTGFFTGDTQEPTIPGPEQSIGVTRITR